MEIIYIKNGDVTDSVKRDIDIINETCLAGDSDNPDDYERDMYDWEAPEDGKFLLFDGDHAVGRVAVHITESEYNNRKYTLGGFGGLAVMPGYRGRGYGRMLAEAALRKASELGVDVACMCVDMTSGITDFYKRLGYGFLSRPAHFTSWNNKNKTDDTVMICGVADPELAKEILSTEYIFHYGNCKGHW